jgi:hypothetical protein
VSTKIVTVVCENYVYIIDLPIEYQASTVHIKALWAILVTATIWAAAWKRTKVNVYIDSKKVNALINTGSTRDVEQMTLARNIWLVSALSDFAIWAKASQEYVNYATDKSTLRISPQHVQAAVIINHEL